MSENTNRRASGNHKRRSNFNGGPNRRTGGFGGNRSSGAHRGRRPGGNAGGRRRGPAKKYINPQKFIQPATAVEQEAYKPQNQFADFDLHPSLHDNLAKKGFVEPSAIQDQVIPPALEGQDVIGIANTGTGKTAAFALPVLHHIINDKSAKVLIITPTRELAEQVLEECMSLAHRRSTYWALLIGGTPMNRQLRDLRNNPNLMIGTPGRIMDHINRGSLDTSIITHVVLDEVDRMLDMGFVDDMRKIMQMTTSRQQNYFFSATIDERVRKIINDFSDNPVEVSVRTGETSDNVDQNVVYFANESDKMPTLKDLLSDRKDGKVLVFDETRGRVERLARKLHQDGYTVEPIHGGLTQGRRRSALKKFKGNECDILVATDVAGRGIDVKGIKYVINFSTPDSYEDYIHRIGRAGRAGEPGQALTFVQK